MADDFWSRRKARVQAEALDEEKAREQEAVLDQQNQLAQKTDDEILSELKLPDPETLEKGDDFSAFMQKAVPDRIRRRALRKLWLSNPVLANVDNLVDYGEDFTDAACAVENLQTAYQVGKGMLYHVLEMEKQKEEAEDDTLDTAEVTNEEPQDVVAEAPQENVCETKTLASYQKESESEEDKAPVIRRKMRFEFAQET